MTKRQSEYTPAEWADLFPEQRYLAKQAEADHSMGRAAIPVRAADGRSTVYIDPITRAPVRTPTIAPARRMG
jgi:hypothetical protein